MQLPSSVQEFTLLQNRSLRHDRFCSQSALFAILTALPSPTLDSWPWPTVGLPSDGETTPMGTRLERCPSKPMNFYVASCCMSCPPVRAHSLLRPPRQSPACPIGESVPFSSA